MGIVCKIRRAPCNKPPFGFFLPLLHKTQMRVQQNYAAWVATRWSLYIHQVQWT